MNSGDVHRHQAHQPLGQPGPTALPTQTPFAGAMAGGAPLSPGAYAPSAFHNNFAAHHIPVMSSSVRVTIPQPTHPPHQPPAMSSSLQGAQLATCPGVQHHPPHTATVGGDMHLNTAPASAPAQARLASMAPWHHGAISRERAEQLLSTAADGVFLVRESTNFPGDHTLCVRWRGRVEHYRVKWAIPPPGTPGAPTGSAPAEHRLTIDDEEFFDTMADLIDHYLQDADGLCTQLVRCLPKQTATNGPVPIISTNSNPAPAFVPPPQQPPPQAYNQPPAYVPPAQPIQVYPASQVQPTQGYQANQGQPTQGYPASQAQPTQVSGYPASQAPPPAFVAPPATQQGFGCAVQGQADQLDGGTQGGGACLAPQAFVDAGWMISERDLEIRENIGKGEFGDVMLGILNGTQKVAVKILKDREAANKFLAEASLMTSLKHENLVRLLGLVFSSTGSTCIVTEHMSQGSLLDYLRSRGRHYVTQKHQINFAYDACCGMEYLERRRVVHRDLAARNVLIARDGTAKVADFGLARPPAQLDAEHDAAAPKLPIKWTAPEALKYNKFSNKSDMWSFGILLWEIYSFGRVPYPRIPLAEVVRHVERGYRMEAPEGCPPDSYELMCRAWAADPAHRPTFAAARLRLKHVRAAAEGAPVQPSNGQKV